MQQQMNMDPINNEIKDTTAGRLGASRPSWMEGPWAERHNANKSKEDELIAVPQIQRNTNWQRPEIDSFNLGPRSSAASLQSPD